MNHEIPHESRSEHEVVVVGGGPAGMMLAAELTLANVDVVVVERRETQDLESPRSRGLHARTIEVLDQRGIADRFLAAGTPMQVQAFAGMPLDISDFPTRHNYGLALVQSDFERIMAAWLAELGVKFMRSCEVTGFTAHHEHVEVTLADGATLHAEYLVGCDGSRSLVRKTAGIEFAGWDPSVCWITAEVEMREKPEFGMRGGGGIGPAENGRFGVTLAELGTDARSHEPTLADLRAALVRVDGTDYGAHSPRYIARFTDMTRQAVTYRTGRVLIAGDAAHVHAPLGGQGLNLGIQDSVNLGWKLAQVVNGTSPETLLDSYEAERHPVAAKVMRNTMAQRALSAADERTVALRDIVADLLILDEARKSIAGMISGLDIHYRPDVDHHPIVGRRVPDLKMTTANGAARVYGHLHDAKALLLDLDTTARVDLSPWSERVTHIVGTCRGPWELPIVGTVETPSALLIRPDGYVAWAGTGTYDGLHEALTTWFGEDSTPR
jgi:2-polyprenyl-6-methoxyphenol hydroxylase-like FAD-dependent oxidoreductase